MIRTFLPYILVYGTLLTEIPIWRRHRQGSQKRDQGSLWFLTILLSVGYAMAFWRRPNHEAAWGTWCLWLGCALVIVGTTFRHWAVWTLGHYFTVTVETSADQRVVESGPYRFIRHPSYTGGLIAAIGIGVSLGNWESLLLIFISMTISYAYRIKVEETALCETLGQSYQDYMTRTKRLLPFIF